jgi:hypothetical protein
MKCLFVIGMCCFPLLSAPGAAEQEESDARALMARVYAQTREGSRITKATIEIIDGSSRSRLRQIVQYRLGGAEEYKSLVIFTGPEEIRGVRWLLVASRDGTREQWLFTPATHRTRRLGDSESVAALTGGDVGFSELGAPRIDDFHYRLLEKGGPLNGHPYRKVEAIAAATGKYPYASVLYWVADDIPCILAAEVLNAQHQTISRVDASNFAHSQGVWGPRRIERKSGADGSRTILRIDDVTFGKPLAADLFTPQGLDAAPLKRDAP